MLLTRMSRNGPCSSGGLGWFHKFCPALIEKLIKNAANFCSFLHYLQSQEDFSSPKNTLSPFVPFNFASGSYGIRNFLQESNPFGRPYNILVPQDQTSNNPLLPHRETTMQANNALLQFDALHDPTELSYNPRVAREAAQAFSEIVRERNPDYIKLGTINSEPVLSLMTGESNKYGNPSSAPKYDRDGTIMSAASGSKRSTDGDQDDSNKDSPLSMKKISNMIIGDVDVANSLAPCYFVENPSGMAQNLGTVVKESDTDIDVDAQLKNMEADEIRKERKRLSNRKSAQRSKIKKQKEYEEQCQKINTLKDENLVLTQTLAELSEKCLELTNENDSIEEELVKEYGPESIADLLHMNPT